VSSGALVSPGVGPQPNSQGGKNANFGLSLSQPMLQKCCGKWWGKQSHRNHFAGSKNFIMLADSGEMSSPLISIRRWVIYPPGGLCNQGIFAVDGSQVVRKTSQLQRNKLVTEFPPTPLQNVVTVTENLAEPSWRSVTLLSLQKAAYSLQSREFKVNSRHTINPRKIAILVPTGVCLVHICS
jgi:hypothetical protein